MGPEQNGYQPSEAEIKDAEEHMSIEKAKLSEEHEKYFNDFAITDPDMLRDAANMQIQVVKPEQKQKPAFHPDYSDTPPSRDDWMKQQMMDESKNDNERDIREITTVSGELCGHQIQFIKNYRGHKHKDFSRDPDVDINDYQVVADGQVLDIPADTAEKLFNKYFSFKEAVDEENAKPKPPEMSPQDLLIHKLLVGR